MTYNDYNRMVNFSELEIMDIDLSILIDREEEEQEEEYIND